MNKIALFLLAAALILGGCRSSREGLPKVEPLSNGDNVRVTLDVNISDDPRSKPLHTAPDTPDNRKKAAQTADPAEKIPAAAPAKRKANKVILSEREKKKQEKKRAKRRKRELVPSGVGIIDSELNSVEQSYLRDVRSRREMQVRKSEQQIFGSFSPDNIFKSSQD